MRSSLSRKFPTSSLAAALIAGALAGCARIEQAGGVDGAFRLAMEDLRALGRVFTGEPSPKARPSAAEAARQANAELLNELFQVVLLRAPLDEGEFGVFLGTLAQGASLEGVYNGFTHSAIYRNKEMKYGPASAEALKAFAETLAELQQGVSAPTQVDATMAKPLAEIEPLAESDRPVDGSVGGGRGVSHLQLGKASNPTPVPASMVAVSAASPADVMRIFEGASLFTLKRVLGDEALKALNQQQSRGGLARWYGAFAAWQAGKGVVFGLALRNKADEAFHARWA